MKLYTGKSGYWHWCPGCKDLHRIPTPGGFRFDGNMEKPTFNPSVVHTWRYADPNRAEQRCHYFLRDGVLMFQGDCYHSLSGQSVPLPDIPEGELPDGWDQS